MDREERGRIRREIAEGVPVLPHDVERLLDALDAAERELVWSAKQRDAALEDTIKAVSRAEPENASLKQFDFRTVVAMHIKGERP